jgi:hypothetical protein
MTSVTRLSAISRHSLRAVQCRNLSTSSILRNEATSNLGTVAVQKKPIGGFRGGYVLFLRIVMAGIHCLIRIVGFLFGFSLASSFATYHLLEEYQKASAALQASVDELKLSTEKVII